MSKGIAAKSIDGPIVMSDTEVWCYWRLGPTSTRWMTNDDLLGHVDRLATGIGEWSGDDFHLVVARRRLDPHVWAAQIDEATGGAQAGWDRHLKGQVHQLAAYQGKEIYLGIKLGDRSAGISAARDMARGILSKVGMADPAPAGIERTRWNAEAARRNRGLQSNAWKPRLATATEIAWLIQRPLWRGLGEPPANAEPRERWGPGELSYLAESVIDNSNLRHLVVDQHAGRTHMAFICLSSFPQQVGNLGWLGMLDSIPATTDVSIRGKVISAGDVLHHLTNRIADFKDQRQHLAGARGHDMTLDVQQQRAQELKLEVSANSTPLVSQQITIGVSGATVEELEGNVAAVVGRFRQVGITAVTPAGDQLRLLLEGMPGDRQRSNTYTQVHDPDVLAGSLLTSTTELGDVEGDLTSDGDVLVRGPIIGHVTEEHLSPVHLALSNLIRNDGTGVVLATGQPGGGKSNTMALLAFHQALAGGTVFCIDPKGDFQRLHRLVELGISVTEMEVSGATAAGLLDPFRIISDPQMASGIAHSVLTLTLPPEQANSAGGVLLRACDEVSGQLEPSMKALEAHLDTFEEPIARSVAASMRALANNGYGKLIYGSPPVDTPSLNADRVAGLTEPGIRLFDVSWIAPSLQSATDNTSDMPIAAKLASTSLYLITLLVEQLVERPDKRQSATVVVDEAHSLLKTGLGAALVERLSLMGRSRSVNLVLGTQNMGHIPQAVLANVAVHVAHRAKRGPEAGAVLEALGAADSEAGRQVLDGLQPGQAVMRDQHGRVGRMKVDLPPEFAEIMRTTPLAAVTRTEVAAAKAPDPSTNGHKPVVKAGAGLVEL